MRDLADRSIPELLGRQLKQREVLVVLDNCEHLLDVVPELSMLMELSPGLSILATSRAPLRMAGEVEYSIRPLALPLIASSTTVNDVLASDAVRVFLHQAESVVPGFVATAENAQALATICTRVDGLPLALEIAAVRLRMLSPEELARVLDNRLGVLTSGTRDRPNRHRTVRAAIAWSYDLLSKQDQQAFRQFGVFTSGSSLETAGLVLQSVSPLDALDRLDALLEASLLQRFDDAEGGSRYQMLETIREFALERLAAAGEVDAIRDRHATAFLSFAEEGEIALVGPDQARWTRLFEAEYGNLLAGMARVVDKGDAERSHRMGSALWRFWAASGRLRDGEVWLDRALALGPDDVTEARAQALLRRGNIAVDRSDYPLARSMYEACLVIYRVIGDELKAARALAGLALVCESQGQYGSAKTVHDDVIRIASKHGWVRGELMARLALARIALARDQATEARSHLTHAQPLGDWVGDRGSTAYLEYYLGKVERMERRATLARSRLERALTEFRDIGDKLGSAYALNDLALLDMHTGNNVSAAKRLGEVIQIRHQAGDREGLVVAFEGLARLAISTSRVSEGIYLLTWSDDWRKRHGVPAPPADRELIDLSIELARAALTKSSFDRARKLGETFDIHRIVAIADSIADSD